MLLLLPSHVRQAWPECREGSWENEGPQGGRLVVTSHVKFMFDVHSEFCPVPGWKPEGPSAHEKKNTKDVCVSGSVVCVLGPCRGKVGRRYLWEIWCRQGRLLELRRIHGLFEGEKVLIPLQSAISSFFCCDIGIDLATLWFCGSNIILNLRMCSKHNK